MVFAVYRGGIFAFGYRFPSGRKNPAQLFPVAANEHQEWSCAAAGTKEVETSSIRCAKNKY
jgi:hypothetical protein